MHVIDFRMSAIRIFMIYMYVLPSSRIPPVILSAIPIILSISVNSINPGI